MSLSEIQQIFTGVFGGTTLGAVTIALLYVFIKPLVVPISLVDRLTASYKGQIDDLKRENDTLRLVAAQATTNAENSLRQATDLVQRIRSVT